MTGKIAAIRRLREAFGLGLFEAKQIADGDRLLTQIIDVSQFDDADMALVHRAQYARLLERENAVRERVGVYDLDAYYIARRRADMATRAERRAIQRSVDAQETLRDVTSRILGRDGGEV